MKRTGGFILLCLILTLGYFIGILKFLTENEEDMCEMTYMFEYPQYVKISNNADKNFKKYGLYAYSEGRLTEKTRNMYFDGIPVLFIPGNKGSYKQVRSLSSVALRKWLNSRVPFHFDYFTVDLNDEFSGIYGPLLYDQLQYVNSSLYRILELYHDTKYAPKSVILIGHSMGGVVAMKLLSDIPDPNLVPILITLASPLKRSPIMLDYHLEAFFSETFNKNLGNTTVISVAGGYRDITISPFLTGKKEQGVFHVMTSSIPISWTESNHVQILWCKQVVMALNRALFDSVDIKTKQISSNSTYRKMVFQHYLVHHSGTKVRQRENYFKPVQLSQKGQWIENIRKQYSVEHPNGLNEVQWYMIALTNFAGYEKLAILAVNMDTVDWVFACNAYILKEYSRMCREAWHMAHRSEIVPSIKYKRRFLYMDLKSLKKEHPDLTHLVVKGVPTDDPLEYHVDVHGTDQRSLTIQVPSWFSFKNQVILEKTPERALYYELILPQLNHVIQYYTLLLQPLVCLKAEHHASVTLTVPWSNENYHGFVTNNVRKPFNVRLLSSKPSESQNSSAVIKLILDPSCTYRISIQPSIFGSFGQLARIYTPTLLANIAAVALMSLRYQFKSLEQGYCSILFVAIQEGAKPYYVLTGYKIISRLLSLWFLPHLILKPDYLYMLDDGTDFFLLPLLLYLCSVGILWILTVVFTISLVALESTVHKLSLKLLAATVSFNLAWSDYFLSYLHKLPVVVALTLICLSMGACGGLALCLGAGFYFLRLTQMSQDFVEEVVWFFVKKFAKKCKNFLKRSRKIPDRRVETQRLHTQREIKGNYDDSEPTNAEMNDQSFLEMPSTSQTNTEYGQDHTQRKLDENSDNSSLGIVNKGTLHPKLNKSGKILRRCDITPEQSRKKDGNDLEIVELKEDGHLNDQDNVIVESLKSELEQNQSDNNEQGESDCDDINVKTDDKSKSSLEKQTDTSSQCLVKEPRKKLTKVNKSSTENQNTQGGSTEDPPFRQMDLSSSYNPIFFHSTIFILWCIVTIINIPAVLTWAHNFKYSTALEPDDSFIPGFALSVCALVLWQFEFPKTNRKWSNEMENFIMVMAILSLIYATISIYRLNYILTFTIIVVTFHQLLAPKIEGSNDEDKHDKYKTSEKPDYSDLKMKME